MEITGYLPEMSHGRDTIPVVGGTSGVTGRAWRGSAIDRVIHGINKISAVRVKGLGDNIGIRPGRKVLGKGRNSILYETKARGSIRS